MANEISILLLHGDAEARLLADGESAVRAVLPAQEVAWTAAWMTRPDWLYAEAPAASRRQDVVSDLDTRALLQRPHALVICSLLPAAVVPGFRHRSGGGFLAHAGLRERWSAATTAEIEADYVEEPPQSPAAVAAAFAPVIEGLQARGTAVAVCTSFRHVREPLRHRCEPSRSLRELVRASNLEAMRLSRDTGCYVLDLDRPLAQEGGSELNADYQGGAGRAAEIALDELAALILDALPDAAGGLEVP